MSIWYAAVSAARIAVLLALSFAGATSFSQTYTIDTVAGAHPGYAGDGGSARRVDIGEIGGIAFDRHGNLFIADSANNVARRVTPAGIITTIAGTGNRNPISYSLAANGDGGPARHAIFDGLSTVAVDAQDNLYIAERSMVRRIGADGTIIRVAGGGSRSSGTVAIEQALRFVGAIALDPAGNLYLADESSVRRVTPAGIISTLAPYYALGPISHATALATDAAGRYLYLASRYDPRVYKVDLGNGTGAVFAGTGVAGYAGDNGPAAAARLDGPDALATDAAGNVYIRDGGNKVVRKVSAAGVITTVSYAAGDRALAVGPANELHMSIGGRIFRIPADFSLHYVVGLAGPGTAGEGGRATAADVVQPTGIAFDAHGNLYITAQSPDAVYRVSRDGILTTIAGTNPKGFAGNGGPARAASLNYPAGIAVDALGNVYVADSFNHVVRRIDPTGIIDTVAGVPPGATPGVPGIARGTHLVYPKALAFNAAGELLIGDQDRLSKLPPMDGSRTCSTNAHSSEGCFRESRMWSWTRRATSSSRTKRTIS